MTTRENSLYAIQLMHFHLRSEISSMVAPLIVCSSTIFSLSFVPASRRVSSSEGPTKITWGGGGGGAVEEWNKATALMFFIVKNKAWQKISLLVAGEKLTCIYWETQQWANVQKICTKFINRLSLAS